jgi:hypothetical protein
MLTTAAILLTNQSPLTAGTSLIWVCSENTSLIPSQSSCIEPGHDFDVSPLQSTSQGVLIEIYAFSRDKVWRIMNICRTFLTIYLSSVKYFDLEVYELPSENNI